MIIPTIVIRRANAESLQKAIEAYASLTSAPRTESLRVELYDLGDGKWALRFPDGVHAYYLVNLIGWLNEPPEIPEVSGAVGWYDDGHEVFYLFPDPQCDAGDTLLGCTSNGKVVSVYQPENTIAEVSDREVEYASPPSLAELQPVSSCEYAMEKLGDSLNPKLARYSAKPGSSGCFGAILLGASLAGWLLS